MGSPRELRSMTALALGACLVLVAGCSSTPEPKPQPQQGRDIAALVSSVNAPLQIPLLPARSEAYDVGPLDVLTFRIFNLEKAREISTFELEVDVGGYIEMPLAGTLHVAGKTVAEIRALATQRLGDNYLVNPQISVTMKDYLSRPIAVLGSVEKGGVFYIRKNFVTVTEALSLAGGLNEKAGTTAIVIEPQLQGPPKRTEISIVDLVLKADPSNNIPIGPHATITVLPAEDFYVVGYVPRPGNFPFHRPLTVTQAVGLAGGVDERGSLEVVEIKRPTAQGMEKIPVDLVAIASGDKPDLPILPHDTIQVGRTWTKAFLDFIDKIASHFGFGYSL